MTIEQQRKILTRISELESDIAALKKVRMEIATSGYASATISSQGGSQSYSRMDLDKIAKLIQELQEELAQYTNMLLTGKGKTLHTIATIYS